MSHPRSDNGTNFIRAKRVLKEAFAALNQERIQGDLSQVGILWSFKWSFDPPAGSHHGDVWELMIRLVRRVLSSVLCQQMLDDDRSHTVLCEVGAILNEWPVTMLSDEPSDLESLTPNPLLLLEGKPALPVREKTMETMASQIFFLEEMDMGVLALASREAKVAPEEEEFDSWRYCGDHGLFNFSWFLASWQSSGGFSRRTRAFVLCKITDQIQHH